MANDKCYSRVHAQFTRFCYIFVVAVGREAYPPTGYCIHGHCGRCGVQLLAIGIAKIWCFSHRKGHHMVFVLAVDMVFVLAVSVTPIRCLSHLNGHYMLS